jgi:hypothetical protein
MTEAQWRSCTSPWPMLAFLQSSPRATERKLRLFACACCRAIWPQITSRRCREAVEMAEQYADGLVDRKAMTSAGKLAHGSIKYRGQVPHAHLAARSTALTFSPTYVPINVVRHVLKAQEEPVGSEVVCDLIRDVFGSVLFRSIPIEQRWLDWQERTVSRLAESIYTDQAFDRLPILADALEEAGCTDAEVLNHLRGPGPHVRGCFVLDLLLSKDR